MKNISKIFFGAFSFVYHRRLRLFKALSIPSLLLISLGYLQFNVVTKGGWAYLLWFASFPIYAVFAISTHRIILSGPDTVPEWGYRTISMREVRFIGYFIALSLIMIPFALLMYIPVVGWLLAMVTMSYVAGRVSLVFPAIATDMDWTFRDSWIATRNHQLMMAVVVVVLPVILSIPETALASVPYFEIPAAILSLCSAVFTIAALSLAFRVVWEENQPTHIINRIV